MVTLETKRTLLRPWKQSDHTAVHTYASNIDNIPYMQWGPNDSIEQSKDFIKMMLNDYKCTPLLHYAFAIILKDSDIVIGGCDIILDSDLVQAEVGWLLNMNYWKQGLGTEIARELLRFGFEELNLRRIIAHCDSENYGSFKVMEKNNMRREGYFIKGRYTRGEWRDEYSYAILKEEWNSKK